MRPTTATLLLLAALAPAPAGAARVFLNGADIAGVKDIAIKNCEVRIDAQGDVHINAPGYRVETVPGAAVLPAAGASPPAAAVSPAAAASPAPAVSPAPVAAGAVMGQEAPDPSAAERIFVYATTSAPGQVQYDVDVWINGRWFRRLRGGEPQEVFEITGKLVPGRNVVQLSATKNLAGGRAGTRADQVLDVLIGRGTRAGSTITIDKPLGRMRKTAADTANDGVDIVIQR